MVHISHKICETIEHLSHENYNIYGKFKWCHILSCILLQYIAILTSLDNPTYYLFLKLCSLTSIFIIRYV